MPKCSECGALYGTGDDFCPQCGKQFKKKKAEKPKSAFNKAWVVIFGIVIVFIFLSLFFFSTSQVGTIRPSPQREVFPETYPKTEAEEPTVQQEEICSPPRILYEGKCCLDVDNSGVCDMIEEALERAELSSDAMKYAETVCRQYCNSNQCGLFGDNTIFTHPELEGKSCINLGFSCLQPNGNPKCETQY